VRWLSFTPRPASSRSNGISLPGGQLDERPDRRAMVERPGKDLSGTARCALLNVARPGVYRPKPVAGAHD
jgi:hypothetical protein